jgi:hypothetical protein
MPPPAQSGLATRERYRELVVAVEGAAELCRSLGRHGRLLRLPGPNSTSPRAGFSSWPPSFAVSAPRRLGGGGGSGPGPESECQKVFQLCFKPREP